MNTRATRETVFVLPTRRQFLLAGGVAGAAAAGVDYLLRKRRPAHEEGPPPPVRPPRTLAALTLAQYFVLAAAAERVFPGGDTPGALDLEVPVYVDRALGVRPSLPWTHGFQEGLDRLGAEAIRRFAVPLHRAPLSHQVELLGDFATDVDEDNVTFFRNLVTATLEGALGDPTYGGNPGGAGWESLGFLVDPFVPSKVRS